MWNTLGFSVVASFRGGFLSFHVTSLLNQYKCQHHSYLLIRCLFKENETQRYTLILHDSSDDDRNIIRHATGPQNIIFFRQSCKGRINVLLQTQGFGLGHQVCRHFLYIIRVFLDIQYSDMHKYIQNASSIELFRYSHP